MPKKSTLSYKEVKDIAYKTIKASIDTHVMFRQLQYQSVIVFLPSDVRPVIVKQLLDNLNTNWHFIVVCDDYVMNIIKNEKQRCQKVNQ